MAYNRAIAPKYVKGTMEVWCYNPTTFNLDYYSDKIATDQLTTTANMGAINAGIGNPVVMNLPDTCAVNLTITAADFSLEARQLSVGGALTYNGIVPVCEEIVAASSTLTVTKGTPVAPYGYDSVVGFVGDDGVAYAIDPDTSAVSDFVATPGETYIVRYFIQAASAQQLTVNTVFDPSIEIVMIKLPAYSAQGSGTAQGTRVGSYYIWIPRMQFGGKADVEASQTTASTTDISGTALSYRAAVAAGCEDAMAGALAYMVYMPEAGAMSAIEDLVVLDGGAISVGVSETAQIPVKYIINGQLVQPNFADLSFTSASTATATVDANGVVTGVLAGDTEVTITLADPALTAYCNVTVS